MKKYVIIVSFIFGTVLTSAQLPEKMSYQAVVRNSAGQLLVNQNISIKASILKGSDTGISVYAERLSTTTNANGLANLEIGSGTVLSGTFAGINWSTGNYYLKTETDPNGGTNYTISGASQLLSVPYAMYAKLSGSVSSSPWITIGNNISNTNTGNIGIGTSNPTEKFDIVGKTKTTMLQLTNGAGVGKLLTSDAVGNANWAQVMRKDVLGISPYSFVSEHNNHNIDVVRAYFPNNINNGLLIAQVKLPTGAIISQNIKVYLIDNNLNKDYKISLIRVPQGSVFPETLLLNTTYGASSAIETYQLPVTTPITIDNSIYFYYVSMFGDFQSSYDGINGVEILYSYPINN